ncbi:MAG: Gfo/Idh/MocA family oxidoreductase [Chloroflexia bacterium]|nr:Gfo/Idh/MocA family oxidoreductase [Chloroflexia bacterium]
MDTTSADTVSAPIPFAVLGLGRMGRLYAETLRDRVPAARLIAAADPDPAARAAFAVEHPGVDLFADPVDALDGVDAVVIATPTRTHHPLVIAAAGAGRAIFCEKPLALTVDDTRAAIDAVDAARVPLQVGFMRRFDAAYVRAKALIDAGSIGEPIVFESVGRDPFCPRPEYADPVQSGGLIVDMAIHDFDLARWLMGREVERVSAEGALLVCDDLRAVGDIDNASINLRFTGGALGHVEVSRNAFYGYDIRSEVLGTEGALTIGQHQQTPVVLLDRQGAHHDVVPYLMERFGDAYRAQLDAFVTCLRDGSTPRVTGEDGLAALAIAVASTRSQRAGGQPMTVADVLSDTSDD